MELEQRLRILGRRARFDLCGDCDLKGTGRVREEGGRWHYPELVPDGKNSVMLRVLMNNRCEKRCYYCENAAHRDFREASLSPDELAGHFAELFRQGLARSLFLSSAIKGSADITMTRMVEALELIRFRHKVPAYIHLKILPGVSDGLIERAVRLATRISVNLEVPSRSRMDKIGSPKEFDQELYGRIRLIHSLLKDPRLKRKSQTTQFVVGAAGETDKELIGISSHLYKDLGLSRIYFSAFQEPGRVNFGSAPAPLQREHRLYQVDFLLRKYGFQKGEIPLERNDNLSLHEDPKTAWARLHPEFFPLEINTATRSRLLRVPGLGPIYVSRLLKARQRGKITSASHLKALGIRPLPALRYLLFDGAKSPETRELRVQDRFLFT